MIYKAVKRCLFHLCSFFWCRHWLWWTVSGVVKLSWIRCSLWCYRCLEIDEINQRATQYAGSKSSVYVQDTGHITKLTMVLIWVFCVGEFFINANCS